MLLNRDRFSDLQRDHKLLFILDGYDEVSEKIRKHNFYGIHEVLYGGNSKLIITSRPSAVRDGDDKKFHPGAARKVRKVYAAPFDDAQVAELAVRLVDNLRGVPRCNQQGAFPAKILPPKAR